MKKYEKTTTRTIHGCELSTAITLEVNHLRATAGVQARVELRHPRGAAINVPDEWRWQEIGDECSRRCSESYWPATKPEDVLPALREAERWAASSSDQATQAVVAWAARQAALDEAARLAAAAEGLEPCD